MSAWGNHLGVRRPVSVEGGGEGRPLRPGCPGGTEGRWVAGGTGGRGGDTCSLWGPQLGGRSRFYFCNWFSCGLPKPLPVEEAAPASSPPLSARPGTGGTRGTRGTKGTGGRRPPARPALTGPGRLPPQGYPSPSYSRPPAWDAGLHRPEPPDPWGRPRGKGPSQES